MNPYASPQTAILPTETRHLDLSQWWSHSWNLNNHHVHVLHQEPFRLKWFATQLVTFVFVIQRTPDNFQSVENDYSAMREFAGQHKKTWLPFSLHCGYALMPIYVGRAFPDSVIHEIRNRFRKRWCVFHVPSLLNSETAELYTLEHKSFWGCMYRDFIHTTISQTAHAIHSGAIELSVL